MTVVHFPASTARPGRFPRVGGGARPRPAPAPARDAGTQDPMEVTLHLAARARVDITDVRDLAAEACQGALGGFAHCAYCSPHTTAGYLPPSLVARLQVRSRGLGPYIELLRTIFPENAGYSHDELARRTELTPSQRRTEPRNGDSHLAFIGGGLRAYVTAPSSGADPVLFIDLDGMSGGRPRQRSTRLVGFNGEVEVARRTIPVRVSPGPIDAVDLQDPRHGLYQEIDELLARHGVAKGRVHLALAPGELGACLTVNEYETLLMRDDMADVLQDPLRFAARRTRHLWADPAGGAQSAIECARGDLARAVGRFVDAAGLGASWIEHILRLIVAVPTSRFLLTRRSIDLLVSDDQCPGRGQVFHGRYQAAVLLQWHRAARHTRAIDVRVARFS